MKVAYIADHRGVGNDDEGAIAYALEVLGCNVCRVQEASRYSSMEDYDFALFHHHWRHLDALRSVSCPKVFWFFDVIDHPLLLNRHTGHLERMLSVSQLGFCTDGKWANAQSNVVHLMQGADERYTGKIRANVVHDIMFAGSITHPPQRKTQLKNLQKTYRGNLYSLTSEGLWVFGLDFARKIAKSKIVISLQLPSGDSYWSNRVYVVSGFGGFLIHPYCKQLADHYVEDEEIVFYRTEDELKEKINQYLPLDAERERISVNALHRTLTEHTYLHRCEKLIEIVKDRIL